MIDIDALRCKFNKLKKEWNDIGEAAIEHDESKHYWHEQRIIEARFQDDFLVQTEFECKYYIIVNYLLQLGLPLGRPHLPWKEIDNTAVVAVADGYCIRLDPVEVGQIADAIWDFLIDDGAKYSFSLSYDVCTPVFPSGCVISTIDLIRFAIEARKQGITLQQRLKHFDNRLRVSGPDVFTAGSLPPEDRNHSNDL